MNGHVNNAVYLNWAEQIATTEPGPDAQKRIRQHHFIQGMEEVIAAENSPTAQAAKALAGYLGRLRERGLATAAFDEHAGARAAHGQRLWNLLMLEAWCRQAAVRTSGETATPWIGPAWTSKARTVSPVPASTSFAVPSAQAATTRLT